LPSKEELVENLLKQTTPTKETLVNSLLMTTEDMFKARQAVAEPVTTAAVPGAALPSKTGAALAGAVEGLSLGYAPDKFFAEEKEAYPTAFQVGRIAGEAVPLIKTFKYAKAGLKALPVLGKVLGKRIPTTVIAGGTFGAIRKPDEDESRATNALTDAIIFGAFDTGLLALGKAANKPLNFLGYRSAQDVVNTAFAKNIAIPMAEDLAKITPDWVKNLFLNTLSTRNPELFNILQNRKGFVEEYSQVVAQNAQLTKQMIDLMPDEITGVVQGQTKKVILTPELKQKRALQLLTQVSVPYGKLPTRETLKAGTTEMATRDELLNLAGQVQANNAKIGAKAVNIGLLEPDTYARTSGAYLHRLYDQELTRRGIFPFRKMRFGGGEFKQRGGSAVEFEQKAIQKSVDALGDNVTFLEDSIKKSIDKNIKAAQESLRRFKKRTPELKTASVAADEWLPLLGREEKALKGLYDYQTLIEDLKALKVEDFKDPTIFKIKKEIGILEKMKETAHLRVDIPIDVQMDLGLMLDPTQRLVQGGMKAVNDIGTFQAMRDMFKRTDWVSLSENKEWVRFVKPAGMGAKTWQKISGVKPGQTELWIRPDVYRDALDLVGQPHALTKGWQVFSSFLRKSFTSRFPPFALVNWLGNPMFVEMGNGSVLRYSKTISDVMRNSPEIKPWMDALRKTGDIQDVVNIVEMEKFLPAPSPTQNWFVNHVRWLDESLDKIPGQEFLNQLNIVIDQAAKVEVYRSAVERGLPHEVALEWMRKFTPNPSNLSLAGKMAQKTAVPLFSSFGIETVRIMKNAAIHRPLSFLKWSATPYVLNQVAMDAQDISEEEYQNVVDQLPEFRQKWYNPKIPIKTEQGMDIVDISNFFPWTASVGLFTSFFGQAGNYRASNPLFDFAIKMTTGRDPVTNQRVRNLEETGILGRLKAYGDEPFKMMFSPQSNLLRRAVQYEKGTPSRTTREPISTTEFLVGLTPAKLTRITPKTFQKTQIVTKAETNELVKRINQIRGEVASGFITRSEGEQKVRNLVKQLKEIGKEYQTKKAVNQ